MSLIAPLTLDTPDTLYSKSYAIIVTETTSQNTEWQRVVEYLLLKHSQASLIVYKDNDFLQLRDQLRQLSNLPKYTCFICQPTECGRNFIATIHRLLRTLDTFTPYLDTMWSIVTGSDASLALESVKTTNTSDELIITKGLNFTYVNQDLFEACFTFGDDRNGHWYSKLFGEERSGDEYPKHPATLWCEMFNDIQPDLLVTSGHGNQYSLELPFSNGVLCPVADTSCLCAINNLKEKKLLHDPISSSPNPKVFLPIGNCLMGFCCGSNCMVTLFMGKLGVKQLCGYTVSTWFGRGGWDVLKKWTAIPGITKECQ
ncbi:unnamed protein product [Didymodactylos carnosus]|uniref:Uncharacterized protein n=1 Tax=Didymodactylos carnosus TaxID=1234261 RepID=A0A8S2LRN3_9BILA|nr:unnamed protein product [Didymodactylos carnosus]CAF3903648.1 unnamed protein product [Didymodactylos carnosus]